MRDLASEPAIGHQTRVAKPKESRVLTSIRPEGRGVSFFGAIGGQPDALGAMAGLFLMVAIVGCTALYETAVGPTAAASATLT